MVSFHQKLPSNKSVKKEKNFHIMEQTNKTSKDSNNNSTNKLSMAVLTSNMLLA